MANPGHSGAKWRTLRAQLKARHDPCWLCAQPIDYSLHYPQPMSFSADYVIPWSEGGPMTLENLRAAHLTHNASRGARKPAHPTSRQW